jgi:hypothetical protein
MSGICLAAGVIAAFLPLSEFTLAWTHSIEKIRWEEDYRVQDNRLVLQEARIRGSAGRRQIQEWYLALPTAFATP